jgi:hypothetical protein
MRLKMDKEKKAETDCGCADKKKEEKKEEIECCE